MFGSLRDQEIDLWGEEPDEEEAMAELGMPALIVEHAFRPALKWNGDTEDACYELLSDVATPGGRRFCLEPLKRHFYESAVVVSRAR